MTSGVFFIFRTANDELLETVLHFAWLLQHRNHDRSRAEDPTGLKMGCVKLEGV